MHQCPHCIFPNPSHELVSYADLRPAFHWNLKQLFVFVVAEYESSTNVRYVFALACKCHFKYIHSTCIQWILSTLQYMTSTATIPLYSQPLNQVIIWDKIITSKDAALIKETNEFVKYALIDQGQELR